MITYTRLTTLYSLLILITLSCTSKDNIDQLSGFVNPFIGTDAHGHTYPGAATPYGMVQLSPQTRLTGWDGCSGYHYSDTIIYGFAHTALSGTGVSDYGDILIMPVNKSENIPLSNEEYSSPFKKREEKASAGYYRVFLDKPGVLAEMTVTPRVGYHRYTYGNNHKSIIIDLSHRDKLLDYNLEVIGEREIRGFRRSSNWAKDMIWYFHIIFSEEIESFKLSQEKKIALITFSGDTPVLEIKVALSAVDYMGALNNLNSELSFWGFNQVRDSAKESWNRELSRIVAEGGTKERMEIFYTALYHAMLQPNLFTDSDGRYRGIDKEIHTAENFTNYTVFSLWDTYRAWHPLMTIIDSCRSSDYVKSMLNMYDKGGLLPVWELSANETFCMIGYHSVSVIAEAWLKGVRGYDGEKALEAMISSAKRDHFGLNYYKSRMYIPGDKEHESVSKTLEYSYNDWCIAMMAKDLGKEEIFKEYLTRSQFYKNLLCPNTGFMRPKLNGAWLKPFDPARIDWHFTEANSWQYSFYVPHDINTLIALHGGAEKFSDLLEQMFTDSSGVKGRDMKDVTGLIGQYAHGNEPSHHVAYLYTYAGKPWKTQERVREIMDNFYTNRADGLIGNEDCGQMSAWLVMSAMGFYPVAPASNTYVIGTPWFKKVTINLENGKKFIIKADNPSKERRYIKSIKLNGDRYNKYYITHQDIKSGGELYFEMSGNAPTDRIYTPEELPVNSIADNVGVTLPYFEYTSSTFTDSAEVSIHHNSKNAVIRYTINGKTPDSNSEIYTKPIVIKESGTIKAVAYYQNGGVSGVEESSFNKILTDRDIILINPYHPAYDGGGKRALTDGMRGGKNWRLGGWQGYQGCDLIAVLDLGKIAPIRVISTGFIQDIGSWIWMPSSVTYMISNDGVNYKKIGEIKDIAPVDSYETITRDVFIKTDNLGRYIKVIAKNYGTIPSWHLGSGGNAFIFADEIIVE